MKIFEADEKSKSEKITHYCSLV